MNRQPLTLLWIGLALAILLGALWQLYPLPDAKARLNSLPLQGDHFSGVNAPLSDFESRFFKKINLIKRVYSLDHQSLFVYVLDGTRDRHLVHDPFYCFRGSGWETLSQKVVLIPGGHANLMELTKNGQKRDALYWFTDGQNRYTSPLRYWWETTLRRLTLGRSGPEPVLVMVQPVEKENLNWEKLKDDFPELFAL
jgi:hypothetical protein